MELQTCYTILKQIDLRTIPNNHLQRILFSSTKKETGIRNVQNIQSTNSSTIQPYRIIITRFGAGIRQISGTKVRRFEFGATSSARWHAAVDREESHEWFTVSYTRLSIRVHAEIGCTCMRARAYACARYRPRFTSYLRYRTAPRAGREKLFPLSFPLIIPSLQESLEKEEERGGRKSLEFGVSFFSSNTRD